MVRRELEIDEETDRAELEELAGQSEAANENALRKMRDRAVADFREGRVVSWKDVKSRNGL